MRHYSYILQTHMSDQKHGVNLEKHADEGMTITIQKSWDRDDEEEWPDAAIWIKEQQERLAAILMQY